MLEYDDLLKQFAFDKEFESITRFDFEPIILLSKYITQLCSQEIKDDYLNALWAEMEEIFPLDPKAMPADEAKPKFIFADGSPAELLYTFDPGCRNTLELKEFLGVLRAHWYAAIANLFKTQTMSDEPYPLQEPAYRMPPIAVILDHNGLIRVVTKKFPLISHEQEMPALKTEHTFFIQSEMDKKSTLRWGTFFGEPICLDLKKIQSGAKLFAFSYGDEQEKKRNAISYLVDQFNYFNDPDKQKKIFMPTSVLIKSIEDQNYWPAIKNEVTLHSKNKNCAVRAAHRGIRMLATVDMLCKNLDSGVMVRKNNTPDFAAALELLEKITLPYYFGLSFPAKLFDSYESVEPIIPWESIESQ